MSKAPWYYEQANKRDYEHAVQILESRRRQVRPGQKQPLKASTRNVEPSNGIKDLRGKPSIHGMSEWLQTLGHTDEAINALNIIHVAGTKGKGSTCSFTESVLRAHCRRTGWPRKTGLYTSPHLIVPEERIRLDSHPLTREQFAKYFFEVFDELPSLDDNASKTKSAVEQGPRYLQLFALVAFHIFIKENVDVVILETHSGGEYDATNVVRAPLVTAVTSLGMDHVAMLGPSIEDIAWHKSGIFKPGAVALSTIQDDAAAARILESRAKQVGETLSFSNDNDKRLPSEAIQLKPSVQRKNASLALAAADALLRQKGHQELTTEDIRTGIEQWSWPGRFQVLPDGNRTWFLDAAHNEMSISIAVQWFVESGVDPDAKATRLLIFSHVSELRDEMALLEGMAKACVEHGLAISHAIFTTYTESADEGPAGSPATSKRSFRDIWQMRFPDSRVWDEPTIRGAVDRAVALSETASEATTQILITGSQHLVGPALRMLQNR